MPTFDFSIAKKKISKGKTTKNNSRSEVILKGVKGIVWCDEKAEYSVDIGDGFTYPIHRSCFSCKGHARIYRRGVPFKDRHIYIRSIGEYNECNINHYLPFAPGCVVLGDLVKSPLSISPLFIIKDCWIELDNEKSHEAITFYKKHIEEINNIIRNQEIE